MRVSLLSLISLYILFMSIENYVFPIYREKAEGLDFKGNGFFIGNLFFYCGACHHAR